MSVIRVEKNKNYSVISNCHLKDKKLSLKAKGLLSLMLSLPNDWDYSIEGLATICVEGESSIRTILKELEDNNYLVRNRIRDDKGHLIDCEYVIYEEPSSAQQGNLPRLENPHVDNQHVENPHVDNQGQLSNNNKLTTNKVNIKEVITNLKEKENIKEKENEKVIPTQALEIFKHWNSKSIIVHKELNDNLLKEINKALKDYDIETIKLAIDRYDIMLKDKSYKYCTYQWSLKDFLKQKNAMPDFLDDGSKWNTYSRKHENKSISIFDYGEVMNSQQEIDFDNNYNDDSNSIEDYVNSRFGERR